MLPMKTNAGGIKLKNPALSITLLSKWPSQSNNQKATTLEPTVGLSPVFWGRVPDDSFFQGIAN